jgi:hypothetical protein
VFVFLALWPDDRHNASFYIAFFRIKIMPSKDAKFKAIFLGLYAFARNRLSKILA